MARAGHCRVMAANLTVRTSIRGGATFNGPHRYLSPHPPEAAMPFHSRRRLVGRKPLLLAAATAVGAATLIAPTSANAVLGPVGPVDAATGFPAYVSDAAGTRLDLCLDSPSCLGTSAELTAPD